MANVLSNFARNITKTLIDDIQRKRTNWYYTLGGINPNQSDLLSRGIYGGALSPAEENLIRSEQVYYNKVQPGSVSRTIRRHDWTPRTPDGNFLRWYIPESGTAYRSWCDRLPLADYDLPAYCGVMRDEDSMYDVYMCLGYGIATDNLENPDSDNIYWNRAVGDHGCRVSTIRPIGRSSSPIYFDPWVVYNKETGEYVRDYVDSSSIESIYTDERGDGYTWKYLYSVPYTKMKKFADGLNVPISRTTNDIILNGGAISDLMVTNHGFNYSDNSRCYVEIDNSAGVDYLTHKTNDPLDPIYGSTVATVGFTGLNSLGGFIDGTINVINPGSGYLNSNYNTPAKVIVTNSVGGLSSGIGAEFEVKTSSTGAVVGVEVISPGIGYSPTDKLSIVTGGATFHVQVSLNRRLLDTDYEIEPGSIAAISVIDPGAGYKAAPPLKIGYTPIIGSTDSPTGAYEHNTHAVIKANISGGVVATVTIIDPGMGYPADRSTYLVAIGDGTGAEFTPIIKDGRIIDVIVDNPGSGYSQLYVKALTSSVNFDPMTDSAKFEAVINTGEFSTESMAQTAVEQLAVNGALHSVDYNGRSAADPNDYDSSAPIVDGPVYSYQCGYGYTENMCTVVIEGDGIGATAVVDTIIDGKIMSIKITDPGKGYTFALGTVVDNNPASDGHLDPASVCKFRFNIPPVGGHGADLYSELDSTGISIYSTFMGGKELTDLDLNYSIIGLVRSPVDNNSVLLNSIYSLPTIDISVDNAGVFYEGEVISTTSTNNSTPNLYFRVLRIQGTDLIILPLTIANSSYAIYGNLHSVYDPSRNANILNVTYKDQYVNRNSGDLVYYNKISPISFSDSTGVALKTYINLTSMYCQVSPKAGTYDGSWYSGGTVIEPPPPEPEEPV